MIDLYLRSSPGSPARKALWDYFDNDDTYKPKVAAQGGDGVLTRLSMLALFAIGLLGAVLLLAWLAIRLFNQAAIAFALLLAAPFALFFPLLGDGGRRALQHLGPDPAGGGNRQVDLRRISLGCAAWHRGLRSDRRTRWKRHRLPFACAFTWSVFLKRAELVGWMNFGEAERLAGKMLVTQLAALGGERRAKRREDRAERGGARRGEGKAPAGGAERKPQSAETARKGLGESTLALAEQRHREATGTVRAFEARGGHVWPRSQASPERAPGDLTATPRGRGEPAPATRPPTESEWHRYEQAKGLLERTTADERRGGEKWTPAHLAKVAEEDRELLRRSADPADHAHRAGFDRRQFEELRGPERERAIEAIEKARLRDQQRLEVVSAEPGRVRGRSRRPAEGRRPPRKEESPAQRRERLQRLRRERQRTPDRGLRRNLSRGGGR